MNLSPVVDNSTGCSPDLPVGQIPTLPGHSLASFSIMPSCFMNRSGERPGAVCNHGGPFCLQGATPSVGALHKHPGIAPGHSRILRRDKAYYPVDMLAASKRSMLLWGTSPVPKQTTIPSENFYTSFACGSCQLHVTLLPQARLIAGGLKGPVNDVDKCVIFFDNQSRRDM